MSSRPAGYQGALHKSLVMSYLLTTEQTNACGLGWSCRRTVLAVLHSRSRESASLFPFSHARCHTPTSKQEQGSSWPLLMPRWTVTACACQHFSKERRRQCSSRALCEGRGKEEEGKLLSLLFLLLWELSRGSQISVNVWTSPSTCFFPSQGTAQWLGQSRKLAHHRDALKTSLCFSSPLFAYQCFLGEKEKWKNGWHLHLPSSRDDAALQQSSALQPYAGDAPLHEDRAGHTEKLWLLGVRRLQPEVHPATVYPQLMLP